MAKLHTRNDLTTTLVARARFYRGVQARVARALKISQAHVCLVVKGARRSRRVEAALAEEVRRIQREMAA
ncbi:MAG: hypothetical protein ACLP1Y_09090 [Candidatus Acidiferrales bacterium]